MRAAIGRLFVTIWLNCLAYTRVIDTYLKRIAPSIQNSFGAKFHGLRKWFLEDWNRGTAIGTLALAALTSGLFIIAWVSLDDNRRSLDLSNRAWLAPDQADVASQASNKTPLELRFYYRNVGKSPATDVHIHYTGFLSDKSQIADGTADRNIARLDPCRGVYPIIGAQTVYPSTNVQALRILAPIDPHNKDPSRVWQGLMNGQSLFILFCAAYNSLGKPHRSAFCYFYDPTVADEKIAAPEFCDHGNFAD